ncbi:RNA polymerase sigma factor [Geodermatophilus sp. SYSU D00691]
MTAGGDAVGPALEEAHRAQWPVLVATTVRLLRDLDAAEECVQDAFASALRTWRADGVPANPAAWLTTATRNRATDRLRRLATERRALPALVGEAERLTRDGLPATPADDAADEGADLLRLVLLCAHPALSPEARLALTLRAVCGVPTAQIARVMLTSEPTTAARLTRAKKKIAAAGIPLRLPATAERHGRVAGALDVAHLVLTCAHESPGADDGLTARALLLARALVDLAPEETEARGLLALALLTGARSAARRGPDGSVVLLADQDRSRWDGAAIAEGLALVRSLMPHPAGRFTLQAAIAAEHARAADAATTDWPQVLRLYDALLAEWPTPVVALNRAVAVAEVDGPAAGLRAVAAVADDPALARYPWLPAARADLRRRAGDEAGAVADYRHALFLAADPADRAFLHGRLLELAGRAGGHAGA